MATQDISRDTTDVELPKIISDEIWADVLEESVIMRLANRIEMPGSGITIQTITGEPAADWVSETAAKPVSTHSFGKKSITPYKLAVIEPFSNEFKRDKKRLYEECKNRLPKALAKKFDETVLHGTAPGSGFDVLTNCTAVSIASDPYAGLVAAESTIAAANGEMNGIALSPVGKSILLNKTDTTGRPLFNPNVHENGVGDILGSKVVSSKAVYKAGTKATAAGNDGVPAVVGIAGDWSDAEYGTVEGIKMSIAEQASLTVGSGQSATTIHLWQQNMFAVRFEIEVAFAVRKASEFVRLTGAIPTA